MKRTLFGLLVAVVVAAGLASDALARHRVYHPTLGRFLQRDPVGTHVGPPAARNLSDPRFTQREPAVQYADGMNLYHYMRSNPVLGQDPSGLFGSTTHRMMTESVLAQQGMGPHLAKAIAAANVASDDWRTFLANPYAHALSYRYALAEGGEKERYHTVIRKWQEFVERTQETIITKLKKNCCDCSVIDPLGRLTHSWQDRYYHAFHSWIGWHFLIGGENIPVQEEKALDQMFKDEGEEFLKRALADKEWMSQHQNAAVAALPRAVRATGKVMEHTQRAVGDECWRMFKHHCDRAMGPPRTPPSASEIGGIDVPTPVMLPP